jgi:hypothetical protein
MALGPGRRGQRQRSRVGQHSGMSLESRGARRANHPSAAADGARKDKGHLPERSRALPDSMRPDLSHAKNRRLSPDSIPAARRRAEEQAATSSLTSGRVSDGSAQ